MLTSRTPRFLSDLGSSAPRFAVARRLALLLCAALLVAACNRSAQRTNGEAGQHYEARGVIRGISPDRKTIDVEHEDIRGFMPSMTMPFSVRDPKEISGFGIGDAISFRLTVSDQDSWIGQIKRIRGNEVRLPTPTATPGTRSISDMLPRLREGDAMPPFQLVDQDGRKIDMEKFHGHPLVLTFVFTRCPLPNFCPLMSKNFAELQTAIKNGSGVLAQARLLSVTFDPDFDSPQILRAYAEHEQADPNIWTFATGEKSEIEDLTHEFSVYVQREGGTISHALATALVDRDGNVVRIWRGNGWQPAEIIREIEANKN